MRSLETTINKWLFEEGLIITNYILYRFNTTIFCFKVIRQYLFSTHSFNRLEKLESLNLKWCQLQNRHYRLAYFLEWIFRICYQKFSCKVTSVLILLFLGRSQCISPIISLKSRYSNVPWSSSYRELTDEKSWLWKFLFTNSSGTLVRLTLWFFDWHSVN